MCHIFTFLYTKILGATSAIDLDTMVAVFVFFALEDDALSDSDVIVTIFDNETVKENNEI